ncbi:unnamed protein product [Urochloa humidicola]
MALDRIQQGEPQQQQTRRGRRAATPSQALSGSASTSASTSAEQHMRCPSPPQEFVAPALTFQQALEEDLA